MTKDELKQKIAQAIDKAKNEIMALGDDIYAHPELGYKEVYALERTANAFSDLGLDIENNIAITGCRARAPKENEGPKIAVLGELDAIVCSEHPDAHKETGAVHACGHNIQMAVLYGTALGLKRSGALESLAGSVDFLAVPAEEFIELDYRSRLKEAGQITYFGGKQELIKKGYFDDVDMSMMIHALDLKDKKMLVEGQGNGFVGKKVRFIGKESHAGGAPELGVNALNAAMLALSNIHAQRETFPDEEHIRVHPIITKGGDIVNVIPADVRMELYVRGRTIPGILDANEKVNRSLKAGAMAVGAEVEIQDIPGYLPMLCHKEFYDMFTENAEKVIPKEDLIHGRDFSASFDFGDVTHIMPAIHPFIGGVIGDLHTREFANIDKEMTYIRPAKTLAMTVVDLLWDNAQGAKEILENFEPAMTKKQYLDYLESISGMR